MYIWGIFVNYGIQVPLKRTYAVVVMCMLSAQSESVSILHSHGYSTVTIIGWQNHSISLALDKQESFQVGTIDLNCIFLILYVFKFYILHHSILHSIISHLKYFATEKKSLLN